MPVLHEAVTNWTACQGVESNQHDPQPVVGASSSYFLDELTTNPCRWLDACRFSSLKLQYLASNGVGGGHYLEDINTFCLKNEDSRYPRTLVHQHPSTCGQYAKVG